jgi:hypothetical protein
MNGEPTPENVEQARKLLAPRWNVPVAESQQETQRAQQRLQQVMAEEFPDVAFATILVHGVACVSLLEAPRFFQPMREETQDIADFTSVLAIDMMAIGVRHMEQALDSAGPEDPTQRLTMLAQALMLHTSRTLAAEKARQAEGGAE